MMPANRPTSAPSPGAMGILWFCCRRYAATAPPAITQRQQQMFAALMSGSADSTPITSPPISAGWPYGAFALVVVFASRVGDELLALQVSQRVLQLHQLNEQIVFGIQTGRVDRALEIERQPFLDAVHAGSLRQIHEERHVENDRCGKNAVATQKVDLELHRVTQPAHEIDVVPA